MCGAGSVVWTMYSELWDKYFSVHEGAIQMLFLDNVAPAVAEGEGRGEILSIGQGCSLINLMGTSEASGTATTISTTTASRSIGVFSPATTSTCISRIWS